MFQIKLRISAPTFGLPGRRCDFRVQYHANALRCEAITVSGRTMYKLRRQPGHHRESKTHQEPVGALEAQAPRCVPLENRELVTKREDLRL